MNLLQSNPFKQSMFGYFASYLWGVRWLCRKTQSMVHTSDKMKQLHLGSDVLQE